MDRLEQNSPAPGQIDAGRRRLTQAGLAAPAVVGLLASRQVLGAEAWNCTPSGQVSGNVSRAGAVVCSSLGVTPASWASAATWPSGYVKGVHNAPNQDPKNWGSGPALNPLTSKLFTSVFATSSDVFRYIPANIGSVPHSCPAGYTYNNGHAACKINNGSTEVPAFTYTPIGGSTIITSADPRWAGQDLIGSDGITYKIIGVSPTLQEVLAFSSSDALFVFAQAAIATLLNAAQNAPSFPVSTTTVIAMFNATYNGTGTYQVNDSVSWNRTQVLAYFRTLYPYP
jgi:hypothetical protein